MFITPAYAQGAGGAGQDIFGMLVPFILIFFIMYFLIIRPQNVKRKEMADMIANVRRNDTVITSGGIIGKVVKVIDDHEVLVEIADGVKVKMLRGTLADVRAKGQPVKGDDKKSTKGGSGKGGAGKK